MICPQRSVLYVLAPSSSKHPCVQLYASPWFMTLFANRLELPVLIRLWDHLLLHSEPLSFFFFSVALLSNSGESLLKQNPVVLPEKLSQITLKSIAEVELQ